jgi:hypothetical protein
MTHGSAADRELSKGVTAPTGMIIVHPGKCSSISGQLTFPRYTLMWFIHALDAILELMAVVRKLLSHLIDAAWHVATERGPDGDNLADFELVGGHRFLGLG